MVLRLKARKSRSSPGLAGPPQRDGSDAGWSSPVARQAHNLKVEGSNPSPATIDAKSPAAERPPGFLFTSASKSRARGAGLHPCFDQRAGYFLGSGHRLAAGSGRPPPTDQAIAADVMDQVFRPSAAIPLRVLDLRADLADRLALPLHFHRREVPLR